MIEFATLLFPPSMIIVDKEDLRKALDWFASARTEFFESVGEEAIRCGMKLCCQV